MKDTSTVGRGALSYARTLVPCVLLFALAVGGCARARAADVPVGPPLAMPLPPDRVLPAIEEAPLVSSPGRAEAAMGAPAVTADQAPAAQQSRPAAEPNRQSPRPPPPAVPPAVPPAPAEVTRQVRPQTAPQEELHREVADLLTTVKANLNRLSNASPQQLEEIRVLMAEAQKALGDRNYAFAKIQATKAVTLSTDLLR